MVSERTAIRPPLESILRMPEGPRRTGELAAWFQRLYASHDSVPILVGGAAVELYTGGAYTTGDLDFVGWLPADVERSLREANFRKEGRNWIHETGQIFIELPGSRLEPGETAVRIRVGTALVRVISPEAILVDRLAAWQFWHSPIDGVNAFLLWRSLERRLHRGRLAALAKARGVGKALRSLRDFVAKESSRAPIAEVERWAEQKI